ncbi:gamma-glutamyltransferase [Pararhodospirillum oryzae]|uniref:Gamma-glutamyltransferase n=2 Tax=Pararhodospirillum oryzae TaxID=478448 RepID=A0A512H5M4_9PROT|nr:gamma-glutamyltransferase [Pararhodospirillum oryzae]
MVSAPHHLAAQAGLAVLREGGNAIEATVAAAATAAVVCPHRAGLGGDGMWIVHEPGRPPVSIDGSGAAGAQAEAPVWRTRGLSRVPAHGPEAACTVAGCVSGWQSALDLSARWGGRLPVARLLAEAIDHARDGVPVSHDQERCLRRLLGALKDQPGFSACFLDAQGRVPRAGTVRTAPALARTLALLGAEGLDGFYRGASGQALAADLKAVGALVSAGDLARHRPVRRRTLALTLGGDLAVVHVTPPPTQGLATAMILGLFQRAGVRGALDPAWARVLSEAAGVAGRIRDTRIADPRFMGVHAATYLSARVLDDLAAGLGLPQGTETGAAEGVRVGATEGDSLWIGVADGAGRVVSYAQGLGRGFGSGVVLPGTGVLWHGHGAAFSLDDDAPNPLTPGRKPPHPLAPALARLRDGRVMAVGCSGGLGTPLGLAAVFVRAALFGENVQAAVSAPRWRLEGDAGGRPAGVVAESRLDAAVIEEFSRHGQRVSVTEPFDESMGVAGAIVAHPEGTLEGAVDPRADGTVAAW